MTTKGRMTMRTVFALLALLAVFVTLMAVSSASAHRSRCHQSHACPSDHATYRWGSQRLLCVKPTSDERTARFKIRVRYGGLIYWCRR